MIKKNFCHGYTLIELLVVISISALFFSLAIASYQSFNKNQALKNSSSEIKSVLRDVQNRAITGQKDRGACAEYADTKLLKEWQFEWTEDTRNYSILGICESVGLGGTFGGQTFTLPSTDNIKFTTGGLIAFKPLNQGIGLTFAPDPICIKGNAASSPYYKISVDSGGGINVEKVATCP